MPFIEGKWRPNIKQEQFLALPTSIFEAFFGGSAGPGKTEVLMMYAVVHEWVNLPGFKQLLIRNTFPEIRNEILPRSKEIYPRFGGHFNKSDMAWTFEGGGTIFFGHCDNEDDVHNYDSMEINLFTPDELTSLTEWKYTYIAFTRCRSSNPALPSIVRSAGMPGGIGHTWVKKRFIDPAPESGKIIKGRGGNKRIFIFATLADNPHIDKQYTNTLELLPEAEKKAKKYGDWDSYSGQVFDDYRDRHYPDEPENALHVIEPFDIPQWWPKIVVLDWGYRAMTWVGYAAVSPAKRVYIYREQYFWKTKIKVWATEVKYHIDKDMPFIVKICKSASQDRGQEHTIEEQISEALGRALQLTSNSHGSRIAGKQLLHEYLRWKPKPIPKQEQLEYNHDHAQWILRNKGEEGYRLYLRQFEPPPSEDNLPRLQIFNHCIQLRNAIKACVYAKNVGDKPAEDVKQFDGDDPYDGVRYILDEADKYFQDSLYEQKKLDDHSRVLAQLAKTNDMTAFYRNMRVLEAKDKMTPVSRYHFRKGFYG